MWVCVATASVFAIIMIGMLASAAYKQFHDPLNRLRYNGTIFNFSLVSIPNNRQTRRITKPQTRAMSVVHLRPIERILSEGQIGIDLFNSATFPISIISESAETEIAGLTPPRTKYPKPPITVLPGIPVRVCDAIIPLNNMPCDVLEGKIFMSIKYGLPGKEIHKLEIRAKRVDIIMQSNGVYSGTQTSWEDAAA
jgi:hypothetical protein